MVYQAGVDRSQYLASSDVIDWQHPAVLARARQLARGVTDEQEIVRACFRFVRDEIRHSGDYKLNPVTCKASEVLEYGTGFCYAKSHLLAAVLRANGIPAGLCYQRLTITPGQPPLSLHGLNGVYLQEFGWYRLDARGNKPGVNAQFTPPLEKLAFALVHADEADLPEVWAEPLPQIIQVLASSATFQEVSAHLPDVELITLKREGQN
ncbi:MAG: Cro/Cl family transcriptional regulator [Desulfobulbus sp.]|nr:MAG: Cro/Cl family transcriptional regulator [Desulfobulbus sp.]